MQKAYELIKKYGMLMAEQEYSVGDAKLFIETESGVWSTKPGTDFADIKESDIQKEEMDKLPMSDKGLKAMVYSQTPYCMECLKAGRNFKPSVDDMAQIIGPETASFEKAGYVITRGRTPFEAITAMTVLEKSAEITVLADRIGGAKPLNSLEAKLMRFVYKKKYSKSEATAKADEMSGDKAEATLPVRVAADPQEQYLRELLVDYGKKLVQTGLVQGTWGNLSVRLDDTYMIVTPSGLDYLRLTPADMVKVNIETLEYEGDLKPTSEKGLHAEVYKMRPDIGSVIHTHSKFCSVFAAAEKDMPITLEGAKEVFGEKVKLAGYALPGTKKLMKNTSLALGDNFGAIMSHHGMLAAGADIETAFANCHLLEENGKTYLGMK